MSTYKVLNESTAHALVDEWKSRNVICKAVDMVEWWEVKTETDHPMWREINDAFVNGRMSVVR